MSVRKIIYLAKSCIIPLENVCSLSFKPWLTVLLFELCHIKISDKLVDQEVSVDLSKNASDKDEEYVKDSAEV